MPKALNDAINLRILAELQEDCSLTNIELAERVGLSPSPCLARVRALEEAGIILRRVALLDPVKLGASVSVFIQVTLEKQTEAVLEVFEASIAGLPEVMECYLMTGDFGLSLAGRRARHRRLAEFHRRPAHQDPRRRQYPVELRAEAGQIQDRAAARGAAGSVAVIPADADASTVIASKAKQPRLSRSSRPLVWVASLCSR